MICRACLRARGTVPAEGLLPPTPWLLPATRVPSRQLSATSFSKLPPKPLFSRDHILTTAARRLLSTSAPKASAPAPAQPQETAAASPNAPDKPTYLSEGESKVWDMLVAEFAPTELVVQDISGGCGSMYGIEVSSEKFRGLSMLKQQRLVNSALGGLMKEWHGVQLKTRVP